MSQAALDPAAILRKVAIQSTGEQIPKAESRWLEVFKNALFLLVIIIVKWRNF
jgi:hypothetical protein